MLWPVQRAAGITAQFVRIPAGDFNATPIPEGLTDAQALMLTDAASTSWFGCELANVQPGGDVGIVGLGPIGLMAVEASFAMGAARIFAIDPVAERRKIAAKLGAIPIDPAVAVDTVQEATAGRLLNSVVEVAGTSPALTLAMALSGRLQSVGSIGVNLSSGFDFPIGHYFMRGVNGHRSFRKSGRRKFPGSAAKAVGW